ncbi:hypothetical protein TESG_08446 [Trichophyton tonsurans CBS 112818]|uniref:Uncharacterized protein n=1 Tax=Trichophyton tonsurans (strain CBS 112818) TaxID=647933 RepID=F2RZ02_TRIT1|nr:hypothetical protein TESG_08446 [Trichophyton tonsurans CBS 112818]
MVLRVCVPELRRRRGWRAEGSGGILFACWTAGRGWRWWFICQGECFSVCLLLICCLFLLFLSLRPGQPSRCHGRRGATSKPLTSAYTPELQHRKYFYGKRRGMEDRERRRWWYIYNYKKLGGRKVEIGLYKQTPREDEEDETKT